jgi:hypothetical protein
MTGSLAPYGAQWVGFNLWFGVKVRALWAVESVRPPDFGVCNCFKSLRKVVGKGGTA